LSYANPNGVEQAAKDIGIPRNILYRWRKKYTADGGKTRFAMLKEEHKALKVENARLKMETYILKKATAYFADSHKESLSLKT
jgi:transposase-like protein